MNLEALAKTLKKNATEFATTYNVADTTTELSDDVLLNIISSSITEARLDGEKKQIKIERTRFEKLIKSKFDGLEAKDSVEDLVEELATSVANKIAEVSTEVNPEVQKEVKLYKEKARLAEEKLTKKEAEEAKGVERKTIVKALLPKIKSLEFASDEVMELAIDKFIESNKIIISGEDIYLEQDGKPVVNFDNQITTHFNKFGKAISKSENRVPGASETGKAGSDGSDRASLFKKLKSATDPVEIARLDEQIKNLSSNV